MSYGLQIYSDSGRLAFSTELPCFFFFGKFTLNQTYSAPQTRGQAVCTANITCPTAPLVFIKPNNSTDYCLVESIFDNGNGTWKITASSVSTSVSGTDTTLVAYVFSRTVLADTGYGINVYDVSGSPTFSSKNKVLKLCAYASVVNANGSGATTSQSLSFGSVVQNSYAIGQGFYGSVQIQAGPPAYVERTMGAYIDSSNIVRFGASRIFSTTPGTTSAKWSLFGAGYVPIIDSSLYD